MATDFKPAQEQVNESKRAMLEAMARYGSEGKARFEEARGNVQSAQQEAVQRALQSQLGGPAGTRGFEDVYGRNLASLSSLQAGSEQNLAAHSAANEAYFDKISGALPIVQARMDEDIAKDRADLERELAIRQQGIEGSIAAQEKANAAAAAKAADDARWEQEQRDHQRASWAREDAESSAAAAGPAVADMSDSELGNYLFGAGRNAKVGALDNLAVSPARGLGQMLQKTKVMGTPTQAVGRQIGMDMGVDPNRVSGLTRLAQPKIEPRNAPTDIKTIAKWAKTDEKTATTISKDPDYTSARDWAYKQILEGVPWPEVVDTFSGNFLDRGEGKAKKTRTYQALVNEFLPLFRAADLMEPVEAE